MSKKKKIVMPKPITLNDLIGQLTSIAKEVGGDTKIMTEIGYYDDSKGCRNFYEAIAHKVEIKKVMDRDSYKVDEPMPVAIKVELT